MLDDHTDEQLLARFLDDTQRRNAREVAFHALVTRYQRRLFAVCVRLLGSAADAEDAVQETFIRLARQGAGFRGDAQLSTWLYRVARNVCLDRVRYEARRPSTPIEDFGAAGLEPATDDGVDARLEVLEVRAALDQLDEQSRRLLLLVSVDGLSYAEAATVADLPVGTVKSRVSRTRVRLGELLSAGTSTPDDVVRSESVDPGEGPPLDPTTAPRPPPEG